MSRLPFASILCVFAAAAFSADAPKPEKVIQYRQSVYHVMLWNWTPMAEMVKGKRPFEATEFKRRAERLATAAGFLDEAYAEGSDKGAATDAKPEIWQNRQDFDSKLQDMQRETQNLAQTASSGDEAKIKEQFAKAANSCKACHDKYRAD